MVSFGGWKGLPSKSLCLQEQTPSGGGWNCCVLFLNVLNLGWCDGRGCSDSVAFAAWGKYRDGGWGVACDVDDRSFE